MKNQKGFAHLFILIIILMVGIGTWWLYSKNKLPTSQTSERYYVADIDQCSLIEYDCPEGYQGFNEDKGCGCELIPLRTNDIDISDWKIHTTKSSLFSIKLPGKFIVEEEFLVKDNPSLNPTNIIFHDPDKNFYLYIKSWEEFPETVWGENYTIKNYAHDHKEMLERFGPYIPVFDTISLNDVDAYKISNYFDRDGYGNIFVYSSSANRNYEINCRIKPGSEEAELTKLCDQILSTFEFTNV